MNRFVAVGKVQRLYEKNRISYIELELEQTTIDMRLSPFAIFTIQKDDVVAIEGHLQKDLDYPVLTQFMIDKSISLPESYSNNEMNYIISIHLNGKVHDFEDDCLTIYDNETAEMISLMVLPDLLSSEVLIEQNRYVMATLEVAEEWSSGGYLMDAVELTNHEPTLEIITMEEQL